MARHLTQEEITLIAGGLRIVEERCASVRDLLLEEAIPGSAAIFTARAKQAADLADLFQASTSVVVETA